MAKPTSLAAQLKRDDEAEKRAQTEEDAEVAARPTEEGKVWVRLERAHYDANNVLHPAGVTQLYAGAVPKSAKVLTIAQAEAAIAAEEDGDE